MQTAGSGPDSPSTAGNCYATGDCEWSSGESRLKALARKLDKNGYGDYLLRIIEDEVQ